MKIRTLLFLLMSFLRRQESILIIYSRFRRQTIRFNEANDSFFAQKFSIVILLLTLSSCVNPEPRRPVSHHSGTFMAESVKLNKQINALQDVAIKYYIAQDSLNDYVFSSDGFRYAYIYQIEDNKKQPKIDDEVFFEYEISDLSNTVLYSYEELGRNRYLIDKEDVESGLQNGLKLMKEGEEVKFIFPSFKAFGFSGDREKIGANQPLIYIVKLNKIINNNENN